MAVTSMTAATACIPQSCKESIRTFKPKTDSQVVVMLGLPRLNKAPYKRFQIKSSSSESSASSSSSSSSSSATVSEVEGEKWEGISEDSPAEVPKGPPSLISPLNVQKALRGIAITDADYYGTLGLRIGCSYDQVRVAYQNKVKELSSQGLDDEELNRKLELLKESYTILSSEEQRRLYDWSLARSANPPRYTWPFEADITQTIDFGTPPAQEPEDDRPTRLVGYFILGWLVLAFTLSIALNVNQ